jgi:hypothetical protein
MSRLDTSSPFASIVVSGRVNANAQPGAFLQLKCMDFNDRVEFVPDAIMDFDTNLTGICPDPNSVRFTSNSISAEKRVN